MSTTNQMPKRFAFQTGPFDLSFCEGTNRSSPAISWFITQSNWFDTCGIKCSSINQLIKLSWRPHIVTSYSCNVIPHAKALLQLERTTKSRKKNARFLSFTAAGSPWLTLTYSSCLHHLSLPKKTSQVLVRYYHNCQSIPPSLNLIKSH